MPAKEDCKILVFVFQSHVEDYEKVVEILIDFTVKFKSGGFHYNWNSAWQILLLQKSSDFLKVIKAAFSGVLR